jgi:KDO2-lipid IV(A) lauroyltransferase
MASANPTVRERFEALILATLQAALRVVPLAWVPRIGAAFGWLVLHATGYSRREALHNLKIAFGASHSEEQRAAIAERAYRRIGATFLEFIALDRLPPAEMLRRVQLPDLDVLTGALQEGKGVLLVAAHFGNWEVLSAAVAAAGLPITVFTGGQRNLLVDERINGIRRATGQETVGRASGVRGLLRALKAKRITALAADQHDSTRRHFVSFFGQPVSAAPGPYHLARRTGAPIVFAAALGAGPFHYTARFWRLPGANPDAEEEADLLACTQRVFDKLEEQVRAHPDHYFWMHRRFRLIPPGIVLSPVNRAFLESRLSAPVDSFYWRPPPAS